MEKLLQYIWKHKIFPLAPLRTDKGEEVEVIDPGIQNTNAGPDFFNAKIKIGDTTWVGNVEVHRHASEWFQHGHDKDAAYNNVILHVTERADSPVTTATGKPVPQLQLPIPEETLRQYQILKASDDYPRCHEIIRNLSGFMVHSWMSALVYERLQTRSELVLQRLKQQNGDWEQAFFITLARNFGFGLNGDAFERWARRIPFQAIAKHRDSLFQTEAFFMGQAGLLDSDGMDREEREAALNDEYFLCLQKEYAYLRHKFELTPLPADSWRFMRTRPQNFPHIRLSQISRMYQEEKLNFSIIRDISDIDELRRKLQFQTSEYWETHFLFGYPSPHSIKRMGRGSIDLIIINTIIPTLFAYGRYLNDTRYQEQAVGLLEQLKPEENHIIRLWRQCGLEVQHAADSQALIQLKKEYCDRHECLRCRFGYEFLKSNKKQNNYGG